MFFMNIFNLNWTCKDISKDYLTIYQKCSPMVQKKIGKPKVKKGFLQPRKKN